MSVQDHVLTLHNGRSLGYADDGRSDGKALFYFHGHPGSRFEARFLAEAAARAGVRLIGLDRPGMGLSTYQPGRRLLDWPADVVALADRLDIARFAVVGFSGGGPYAAACAYQIPERLVGCGMVSGVGPISPLLAFLSQWLPWLVLPLTRRFFVDQARAEQSLARVAGRWSEPDQKSLLQPGIRELMAASLVEGLRQGARGAAYDGALLGRPWGFELEAIAFPAIYLWHGERDREVPMAAAQALAARMPHCQATYYPDEAHISVIVNHGVEIVGALVP